MKHFRPRLSRRAFWVLCALLVCLRLALTGFQQAYIWVGRCAAGRRADVPRGQPYHSRAVAGRV
ncbi:hypothetical protein [Gemmiger formicilis]|uniref:hypothetical protein n=1 Tax=Gemmiger formicilis TaxID=745368 RepID=UPI0035227637